MTESASTPRLRTTFAVYLALVGATAIAGPRALPASGYYFAGITGFVCVALACLGASTKFWTKGALVRPSISLKPYRKAPPPSDSGRQPK